MERQDTYRAGDYQVNINLEISVQEAQLIINALQELPHKVVWEVIAKIKAQADSQLTKSEGG